MTAVATAIAASAVIGGVMQSNAAESASEAQSAAADKGIAATNARFEALQKMLAPYAKAGEESLFAQKNLIGLGGADAQKQALEALQQSPQFMALQQQGENAILQNASATGGLRGGNVQGALAQYRPQLLSQLINDQYNKLGGITALGQNAAAGTGNAGMQTGVTQAQLLEQAGAAQAGGYLAQGKAQSDILSGVTQGIGMYLGGGI